MKKEINRKAGYEAPRIEATSFMTEQGYAASGASGKSTQPLNDVKITFVG
ncbi:MAG: hypothetical protein MJZ78_01125 [Bacteroidales bacterium]|nr:hypothetical protein [Bacteroidales bacterium]